MKKRQALCLVFVFLLMISMFSGCEDIDSSQFAPQPEVENAQPEEEVLAEEEGTAEEESEDSKEADEKPEEKTPVTPAEKTETPAPQPVPKAEPQGVTVYITNSGDKYHRDGCRYLSKSKIPILLSNTGGYSPCSVCKPPS